MLSGEMIIGAARERGSEEAVRGYDPSNGQALEPAYAGAAAGQIERACALADAAFDAYRGTSLEARAKFLERIAERLLEMHVEPVVDRRVEEEQREPVHDQHRRHGQCDQHQQHAPGQARAGRLALQFGEQPRNALDDHDDEHEQRQRRRAEECAVEAAEACAAGGRIAGQRQRAGEQHEDRQRRQDAPGEAGQPALEGCHW